MILDRFLGDWSQLLSLERCVWQTVRRCPGSKIQSEDGNLVMENDIDEGAVDV